ncbi:Protein of unknown function DUF262 [Lishizhenia tianjinensis]|uniref:GmrSD restriction endonucleases N-terminal domain-containing protein n=1 Tax=Lishizhenia tianjinensis TaxID=477690 RepID=A0A1I7AI72_9FLAO|nr:DUF262 domain-containing protein [Lishizhenia tianjinensis]SFT74535.1 Protein of unknown function DUF262 [Lishizhenia tianjinensis]
MKLRSSIPANSVKLIDLYNKIVSGSLITGPDYQRKLVWKKQHKYAFIETILLNFPFPEVYIASADLDLNELQAKEVVVDGQQRLTTIVDYIQGVNDFENQRTVKSFDDLSEQDKRDFLNYLIPVKDLKDIGEENIIEVFKRINSTNYSLNSNEVLNAQYGGGEFAIFSKMIADKAYEPQLSETSIDLVQEQRFFVNQFFEKNRIFTDNDIKRMFDSQYIMLLSSTVLEGHYFGRSTKINDYLERYNDDFEIYKIVFEKLYKAINLIDSLGLSEKSYWFNKANLFTLIIELIKLGNVKLDLTLLESKLNELENKADLYFVGDEDNISLISADEMKYFEVARQGSHELSAREHRGKVIAGILASCKIEEEQHGNKVKQLLEERNISYSTLIPTSTGLNKSIMDATQNVRLFLSEESLHNYSEQDFGPENKIFLEAYFIKSESERKSAQVSLYRSNGRGDYRIWFSDLRDFASEGDELVLINNSGLKILNISQYDYSKYIETIKS